MAVRKDSPTLLDVANHCGVSTATVSRVINRSSPVSPSIENQVRKAMTDLGFESRKSGKKSKMRNILIIVPYINDPIYTEFATVSQEEAENLGLDVLIMNLNEKSGQSYFDLERLDNLTFDGIILLQTILNPGQLNELKKRFNVPILIIGKGIATPHAFVIDSDGKNGMYQAIRYLVNLNHSKIAYCSGPSNWDFSASRYKGIQQGLEEFGLKMKPEWYQCGLPTIESGYQLTLNLLQLPKNECPTAIIMFHDFMAVGAIHAAQVCGVSLPDDLSIIGFGNISMISHSTPPLTTVSWPKRQLAKLAIQKIFAVLNGEVQQVNNNHMMIECPLILRESTTMAPVG